MSLFDMIRFQARNVPPEQKLAFLRPEAFRLLNFIEGYATLIEHDVGKLANSDITSELKEDSLNLKKYSEELSELIAAITAPEYREKYGLPELKPYDTLLDALKQTAVTLKLSLAEALENNILRTRDDYPVVIWDSGEPQHKIIFELFESQYHVQLLVSDTVGKIEIFRVVKEAQPETLNEATEIIQRWLLDELSDV